MARPARRVVSRLGEPLRDRASCAFLALNSPPLLEVARPMIAGVASFPSRRYACFWESVVVAVPLVEGQINVQDIWPHPVASRFGREPDRSLRFQQR